jgi:signal transduction histidine kinase/GAF domain-containing protein
MTETIQDGATERGRSDAAPFELAAALRATCDRVREALGSHVSLLVLDDEATGHLCLVAASGLPEELLDILHGAGVGDTRDIADWFRSRETPLGRAVTLERLGAGSPFALDPIAGGAIAEGEAPSNAAVVPLMVHGRVAGALAAYGAESGEADRSKMLELVAAGAAALVDQAWSARRSQRRFEGGQLLARLANRIYRLREPGEILDVTVHDLYAHLDLDACAVFRYSGGALDLDEPAATSGGAIALEGDEILHHVERAVDQGVAVAAATNGGGDTALVLLAPISIRDEAVALLACSMSRSGRSWLPHEVELVRGVADQLGVALSEARSYAEQQAARRDLECLLAGSQALAEAEDLDTVLSEILVVVEQAVGPRACAVLLLEDGGTRLVALARRGCDSGAARGGLPVDGPTLVARAVRERTALAIQNGDAPPGSFALRGSSTCALAAPLVLGDTVLGAILVESSEPRAFGARELRLASALGNETAVAIHRTQLFDRVALGKREWEATFDAMEDGVLVLDRDARILRANRAAAGALGRDVASLLGTRCCAVVCDEAGTSVCPARSAIDTGEPVRADITLGSVDYTLSTSPIRNRAGLTTGVIAVVRRRTPAAVPDEIDVHVARALARSARPVLLLDATGCARWANEAAEHLYGAPLIPLAPLTALVSEADGDRVAAAVARTLAGAGESLDARLRATGNEVTLSLSASRTEDGESVLLVLARDAAAEGHQGSELDRRGRYGAGVVEAVVRHGLAALDRLERDAAERPAEAVSGFLGREATFLERLARFAQARQDRVVEPLELNRIVEAALEATRPRFEGEARERGAAIDVAFEPCRAARTIGNANELKDALAELIVNAVEAQPVGGRIEIKTVERGAIVGVEVRDAGEGMADEVRSRAFDPLYTTKGARAGMGLSNAYGTVIRHGGRISVRSARGEGASFKIVLPAYDRTGDDEAAGLGVHALLMVSDRLRRLRLLDLLEDAGVPAVWATDTRELVWALDLHRPRTIVVDRGAFFDHGDRLVAILRASPESVRVLVVGGEMPEIAAPLASRANVERVDLAGVVHLVRSTS